MVRRVGRDELGDLQVYSKADAVQWTQAGILITSISSHPVLTRGSCGEEGGER